MNALSVARFTLVALAMVGLVSVMCLTSLAEAGSHTSQGCAATKGEELSSSKTSFPILTALPVDRSFVLRLADARCSPVDPTPGLIPANLWGDLFSRAPPTIS